MTVAACNEWSIRMNGYGTNEHWGIDLASGEVTFRISRESQAIVCRVMAAIFEDESVAPLAPEARLEAARCNFDRITDAVGWLAFIGRFEPDGSVLLRPNDLV